LKAGGVFSESGLGGVGFSDPNGGSFGVGIGSGINSVMGKNAGPGIGADVITGGSDAAIIDDYSSGGAGSAVGGGSLVQQSMVGGPSVMGGGFDGKELGSLKYSRGYYFGDPHESASDVEWVPSAIGGNESLLVKSPELASGMGRVISAYEGSTDAVDNGLAMMGGGGHHIGDRDEDEERGQRPGYLKEDPEWWKSAERVVPSVID
jgi:hypothetical protein